MAVSVNYDEKRKKYVWRARASINGKQKERSGACKLKREAQDAGNKAYNDLLRQEKNSIDFDANLLISDALKEWLATVKHGTISWQTERIYAGHIKNNIIPFIGHIKVVKLNSINYQRFIIALVNKKFSKGTIKLINTIMYNFLKFMIDDMRVIDHNVAANPKINIKENDKKEDEQNMYYDDEELNLIFKFSRKLIKNERNRICADIFEVLLYTGIRINELLAIQETDFNKEKKTLIINKQLSYKSPMSNPTFIPLKTKDSYREIAINKRVQEIFNERILSNKKMRLRLPSGAVKKQFMFCYDGMPIGVHTVRYYLKKTCTAANVRYHTKHAIHAFRHTHIKHLVEANIPHVTIKKRVGHSRSSSVTLHYMHSDESMDKQANNLYEKLISERF
ncbi:tyrosine-type recombinase/integrase [Listeria kieliensis]